MAIGKWRLVLVGMVTVGDFQIFGRASTRPFRLGWRKRPPLWTDPNLTGDADLFEISSRDRGWFTCSFFGLHVRGRVSPRCMSVGNCCGCAPIHQCGNYHRIDNLSGLSDQSCFSDGTSQRQVGLLEVSNIKLQRIEPGRCIDNVVHSVHNRFRWNMLLAPNSGRHGADFPINVDNAELVPTRTFHGRDVETQHITGLMCTSNVN